MTTTLEPAAFRPLAPGTALNAREVHWSTVGGTRAVVKAGRGRHRNRLRREAVVLRDADGRGVVRLMDVEEDDTATRLVLRHEGNLTLAADTLPTSALVAARQVVHAVAELHAAGWAHGALRPEHVVLGDGRARLCSVADAVALDGSPAARDALDDDVAALWAVLDGLVERRRPDGGPVGRRSSRQRRRLGRRLGRARRTVGPGLAEPGITVRELRRWLHPGRRELRAGGRRWERRRPPRDVVALLLAACLVVGAMTAVATALAVVRAGTPPAHGHGSTIADSAPPTRRSPAGPPVTPTRSAAATAATSAAAAGTPGTSMPGAAGGAPAHHACATGACSGAAVVGRRVSLPDGRRFVVGEPGDRVAVGDWDCDGTPTVVDLRPGAGVLFEFRRWPTASRSSVARRPVRAPGIKALIERGGSACPQLWGRTADGSVRRLLPPPGTGP